MDAAAKSTFTFQLSKNVAQYTPEVATKLSNDLAGEMGLQAPNQVELSAPRLAATVFVQGELAAAAAARGQRC